MSFADHSKMPPDFQWLGQGSYNLFLITVMMPVKHRMVQWAVGVVGWPSPSYRCNLAGGNLLSVEAGMNDTAKHACYAGVADQSVLF